MIKYFFIIILLLINLLFANSELTKKEKALLDVIAFAEGTGNEYNIIYCYRRFKDYSKHPNIVVCCSGICSTSAGRYQFLFRTWSEISKRYDYRDFKPETQDKAAIKLIREKEVNPNKIETYCDFYLAVNRLNTTWASLPNSPYGQPTRTTDELWDKWKGFLKKHKGVKR